MRWTAWLVLFATLLLWSGNWIVARAVRDDVAPGMATMGRLLIVLAILLPFTLKGLLQKDLRSHWKVLVGLGVAGGGPHIALQWLGLHYTTATSGILYLSTSPIFILLMATPLAGERIALRQWLGVLLSLSGVVLIATHGEVHTVSFNVGDLMAVASMVMWAAYTVLLRMRRDDLNTPELISVVCLIGCVFMLPWVAAELILQRSVSLTGWGVAAVVYSAIGSMLLAYLGWSYVVTRLGAARAGVTMHLVPAMGVVLAALFLAEYPQWYHFVGIGLILAGVRASLASSSR
ncbi:MAG TPA: DMT family transporter [Burkholderiales bacterium]|nr:DMT family transporter [Burkholderiales bacterium]